ncbi:MAG: GntR family transcriptional regulator [Pseudomonadota bacterium]
MTGWRAVRADLVRRLTAREWRARETLPPETALAAHYGVARGTVNRALQSLAEDGVVERRRRAGTIVAARPVRHAKLRVPLVREMVEATGARYGWQLSRLSRADGAVRVRGAHLADGAAFLLEDRSINLAVVPSAATADFARESPNAFLVATVPVSRGTLNLFAGGATAAEAATFGVAPGTALLRGERETFLDGALVTRVRLVHRPGHTLTLEL